MNDIFNENVPLKTETPAFAKHVLPAVPLSEVYLEDCVTALKRFNDKYFDLAIVDPPYGIGEDGGKQIEWKSRPNSIGKKPKHNKKNWDNEIPTNEYWDELFRVSKNQIVWGGNYFAEYLKPNGKWIVWDKLIEIPMFTSCELAWTSFKGNTIKRFKVHPFDKLNGGKDKQHPTQKPIKLYDWILQNYAKEGGFTGFLDIGYNDLKNDIGRRSDPPIC